MTIIKLIALLPGIIKLLQAIEDNIAEAETERKVGDDIKTLHEAFNSKDPAKLQALFATSTLDPKSVDSSN